MSLGPRSLLGDTHRLVVFDAAARIGSFTGAADALGVSQPAVSRQISILETTLGCPVFHRRRNRIELTDAGAALHHHVRLALEDLARGLDAVRDRSGSLTLAVQPAIADSWFAPRLPEARAAVAPASLQLVIFDRDDELPTLPHDAAVRFGSTFPAGVRSEALVSETVTPFAAPELATRFGLDCNSLPAALADGVPLLRLDPNGRGWMTWLDWFEAASISWQPPGDEIVQRSYGMVVQQALSGRGVILGWETLLGDLRERGMLVPVGPAVTRPEAGYHLTWPAGLTRHDGLVRLREWLTHCLDHAHF